MKDVVGRNGREIRRVDGQFDRMQGQLGQIAGFVVIMMRRQKGRMMLMMMVMERRNGVRRRNNIPVDRWCAATKRRRRQRSDAFDGTLEQRRRGRRHAPAADVFDNDAVNSAAEGPLRRSRQRARGRFRQAARRDRGRRSRHRRRRRPQLGTAAGVDGRERSGRIGGGKPSRFMLKQKREFNRKLNQAIWLNSRRTPLSECLPLSLSFYL